MGKRIYVGNIPYDIDEGGLKAFVGHGLDGCEVTQVKIVTDRETGRPRGFAFVEFAQSQHAERAIGALNGTDLGGRSVVVNEAREPQRGPRPGARPSRGDSPRRSG